VAYDIVIRGGTVVDGTGREPFVADLAISDGYIAAIGEIAVPGAKEIDARCVRGHESPRQGATLKLRRALTCPCGHA